MTTENNIALANYRIYDQTGSGCTEDIHASSLEDAIQQGREWIEAGDWEQGECEETLEAAVGPIIYQPEQPNAVTTRWDLWEPEWDGATWSVDVDDQPEEEREKIAQWLAEENGGKWQYDALDARCVWGEVPADWPKEIDTDATWAAPRHDCSGTLPAKDGPECLDGDENSHDWQSPYSVVGGIKENPGVWGSGHGQVRICEVCACCGAYRTIDHGATNSSNGLRTTRTSYEPADAASKEWLMRRLNLPEEMECKGVTVTLDWDAAADITDDDDVLGYATHTVPEADLDEGTADGPSDGEIIEIEGVKFRLGQHDYETNDGKTTCSAAIYRVLP